MFLEGGWAHSYCPLWMWLNAFVKGRALLRVTLECRSVDTRVLCLMLAEVATDFNRTKLISHAAMFCREYEGVLNADVPSHANIGTIVRVDKLAHNRCSNF